MLAKKKVNQPPPVGIPAAEERRPQPVQQPPQPTHLHEPNTPSYDASDQSTASSSSSSPVKPAGVAPPSGEAKRPIGRGRGRGRMKPQWPQTHSSDIFDALFKMPFTYFRILV